MPVYLETTTISAERTCGSIQQTLCAAGAMAVMMEYDSGRVSAVSFRLSINESDLHFRLPCRWQNMASVLTKRARENDADFNDKCRRVAWRQIFRWLQAQLALLQTGMVQAHEVFLPYLVDRKGNTLFERMEQSQFLLEDRRDK